MTIVLAEEAIIKAVLGMTCSVEMERNHCVAIEQPHLMKIFNKIVFILFCWNVFLF